MYNFRLSEFKLVEYYTKQCAKFIFADRIIAPPTKIAKSFVCEKFTFTYLAHV